MSDGVTDGRLTPVKRWRRIVAAAEEARRSEAMAEVALSSEVEHQRWLDYDEACSRLVDLLLDGEAVAMRLAIARLLLTAAEGR